MEIIRSATFEGMADENGYPTAEYQRLYENLAKGGVKTIITGFMFISNSGRAMHPGQAGMDEKEKAAAFSKVTAGVHRYGAKIIAQIAHTGYQTTGTGYEIVGVSRVRSRYFGELPTVLSTEAVYEIIEQFAASAYYAQSAGFDGVQLHAAHGYLIHQFLLKSINDRTDEFQVGTLFLRYIIQAIRKNCGDFPIWVKLSGGVDREHRQADDEGDFVKLIQMLDELSVSAIEISYGTMEYPLNIFRGKVPVRLALRHNPIYKSKKLWWKLFVLPLVRLRIKPYQPCYNLYYAQLVKRHTAVPIAVVGGFRNGSQINSCHMDMVSLCRPFICEPDFLQKLEIEEAYESKCTNCNICAIMCDTRQSLRCYGRKG